MHERADKKSKADEESVRRTRKPEVQLREMQVSTPSQLQRRLAELEAVEAEAKEQTDGTQVCIINDEFYMKHDGFCIKNDGFCSKYDEL